MYLGRIRSRGRRRLEETFGGETSKSLRYRTTYSGVETLFFPFLFFFLIFRNGPKVAKTIRPFPTSRRETNAILSRPFPAVPEKSSKESASRLSAIPPLYRRWSTLLYTFIYFSIVYVFVFFFSLIIILSRAFTFAVIFRNAQSEEKIPRETGARYAAHRQPR